MEESIEKPPTEIINTETETIKTKRSRISKEERNQFIEFCKRDDVKKEIDKVPQNKRLKLLRTAFIDSTGIKNISLPTCYNIYHRLNMAKLKFTIAGKEYEI